MAFWQKQKYCKFCGSVLKADGSCSNEKCIAYKAEANAKTESTTTTKEG